MSHYHYILPPIYIWNSQYMAIRGFGVGRSGYLLESVTIQGFYYPTSYLHWSFYVPNSEKTAASECNCGSG